MNKLNGIQSQKGWFELFCHKINTNDLQSASLQIPLPNSSTKPSSESPPPYLDNPTAFQDTPPFYQDSPPPFFTGNTPKQESHLTTKETDEIDSSCESVPKKIDLDVYVPHDERLSPSRLSELISNAIKATALIPNQNSSNYSTSFEQIEDISRDMFQKANKYKAMPKWVAKELKKKVSKKFYCRMKKCKSKNILERSPKTMFKRKKYPKSFLKPQIIAEDMLAWEYDEEFGRQMIAGTNPVRIQRLQELPPKSRNGILSSINESKAYKAWLYWCSTYSNIEKQERKDPKWFILDHHDYLMPFLNRINKTDRAYAYASRTLMCLVSNKLLPAAIELTIPDSVLDKEISRVFYLPEHESESEAEAQAESFDDPNMFEWELAKAHVAANDNAYHQLVSHWLHTHAVIEPFIIATRRHLSVMHPVYRLLDPHFKDTMHINALARRILLSSGGILEKILFTGDCSMELSSELYKEWRFDEQSLPRDLIKRGMGHMVKVNKKNSSQPKEVPNQSLSQLEEENREKASPSAQEIKETPNKPAEEIQESQYTLKLCMEDYPYASDGLEIWNAIKTWVTEFCHIFYKEEESVSLDDEIQEWWKEIRSVGHGDKKNETWWYEMKSISDLVETLATLIWISSALHASVNFGQYSYAGYPPNRPTLCRKPIPENIPEITQADCINLQNYHLVMLPQKFDMALSVALMEVLSRHGSDEVYLGQRSSSDWIDNKEVLNGLLRLFNTLGIMHQIYDPICRQSDCVYIIQQPIH